MFQHLPKSAKEASHWTVADYQPYFDDLLKRELTAASVEQWLADWTKVGDLAAEVFSRLAIGTSQNTADEEIEKAFLKFNSEMMPALQLADYQLKKKLLDSGLTPKGFEIPLRNMRADAEVFRESNLPLMVKERELTNNHSKVTGKQSVTWEGKEVPLPELQTIGQHPVRAVREKAWRLAHARFLQDREDINDLWVQLLDLRIQQAKNAGYTSYIDYRFKAMNRFDYTPDDCRKFHDAIEAVVVPAAERMLNHRRAQLGVPTLRPWDMNIDPTHPQNTVLDPLGRAPLHPYQSVEEMEAKAATIFNSVDPELGAYFEDLRRSQLLDLGSRKNKAPGGYCSYLPVEHKPFIFMNAVGIHDDVQTLLHEAGHAFHAFESARLSYMQQKDVPIEFAEVASMGMELLAAPYLTAAHGGYYSEPDAARARVEHLEGIISFWPYMAVVDAFQLWVYSNVEAAKDPNRCDEKWAELWKRFMRGVDWSGLDDEVKTGWHRKLHIHQIPFYYVEYGLAQLGAVQVWRGALSDQAGTVRRYRQALALGGTVTLPKLFETAGAKFAFDADTLKMAVDLVEKTINELNAVH